jgi:hypothetical protein
MHVRSFLKILKFRVDKKEPFFLLLKQINGFLKTGRKDVVQREKTRIQK